MQYVIVNEAGASVYSASKLASEEFPKFDVGQRSAASIARRLQDPLAELVKIDPKSIGVGQYQHDMNQKKLGESLNGVVEDCVNKVGVDLNTASAPLLSYISGISSTIAKNIVAYREENGRFTDRKELLKVPKLGPKAFEQCAGFMRISDGKNPLDATGVHPESYAAAEKLLKKQGYQAEDITAHQLTGLGLTIGDYKALAEELGIGEITLRDIVKELEKPARDPRDEMPKPILRTDVLEMKDLKEGMVLKGTVRNVIDFGVFVDIGVHQDGLVHISQIVDEHLINLFRAESVLCCIADQNRFYRSCTSVSWLLICRINSRINIVPDFLVIQIFSQMWWIAGCLRCTGVNVHCTGYHTIVFTRCNCQHRCFQSKCCTSTSLVVEQCRLVFHADPVSEKWSCTFDLCLVVRPAHAYVVSINICRTDISIFHCFHTCHGKKFPFCKIQDLRRFPHISQRGISSANDRYTSS